MYVIEDNNNLRHLAEERMLAKQPEVSRQMSEDEVTALIHELQVHQIELEMQNEELKRARRESEELKEQYLDLYDFAPVGYFTFDVQGAVLSANLTGAKLLGIERGLLVGRRFQLFIDQCSRAEFSRCVKKTIETGEKCTFEVTLLKEGNAPVYLQIEGIAVESHENGRFCRAAAIDITERKKAEAREKDLEQQQLEFYRKTILAATDGKLVITSRNEILSIAGQSISSWDINSANDLAAIRHGTGNLAREAGMDETRVDQFVLAIGEVTTNTIKHAGAGTASIHCVDDGVLFVVSDRGPGIPALSLPEK